MSFSGWTPEIGFSFFLVSFESYNQKEVPKKKTDPQSHGQISKRTNDFDFGGRNEVEDSLPTLGSKNPWD